MTDWGSGAEQDLERLRYLLERHARLLGDFVLSSGIHSKYYFDSKRVTLSPEGLTLTGQVLYPVIRAARAEAVGGLAVGAIPLSLAVSAFSYTQDHPIPSFIVRSSGKKDHGTKDELAASFPVMEADDDDETGHVPLLRQARRVFILDDVITTGDSVQKAIDAVRPLGCEILGVIALVTRPERGGLSMAQNRFQNYVSVYECDDEGLLKVSNSFQDLVHSLAA
jgi:orotate phosphoribosyltransferase